MPIPRTSPTTGRTIRVLAGGVLCLLGGQGVVDAVQAQMPSIVYPSGAGGTEAASKRRNRDGTYVFDTDVNGTEIPMLFDTGAYTVAIRAEDAERIGIDTNALTYSITVSTANGQAKAAPVVLDTLSVGGITRHRVPAIVGRPGALHANLLGQSFLGRIAGFKREGDTIVLKGD